VAITLARAAPMIVPATPRYEAANAAAVAASALAASWWKDRDVLGVGMQCFRQGAVSLMERTALEHGCSSAT
jgi:hypothetical protein